MSPSHFQVMPVGFQSAWQRWDWSRAGTRKRAEGGENMAAEDYHFYIKRMLSQQSGWAAPVSCDTAQLLVTPRQARWKLYVELAHCLFNKRAEGKRERWQSVHAVVLSNLCKKRGKAAFSHPSMKLNAGKWSVPSNNTEGYHSGLRRNAIESNKVSHLEVLVYGWCRGQLKRLKQIFILESRASITL